MCKAPKPPKIKPPKKAEFLHNRFLDAAIGQSGIVGALRSGRSSLRIPLGDATSARVPGTPLDARPPQPLDVAPGSATGPVAGPLPGISGIPRGNPNNVNPQ
jgi:hypothetical protein